MDFSDTPQISKQAFTNPGVPPIREMPSIKHLLGGTTPVPPTVQAMPSQSATPQPVTATPTEPHTAQPEEVSLPVSPQSSTDTEREQPVEDFATCWTQLFKELFTNDPLIFHTLKDEIPDFQNSIITITVKNGIQKEEFETRQKAILEYWRNHFSINVDDITILVDENKETKEVIINSEDRLRHMMGQNNDLAEFLNILDFKIKD